MPLLTVTVNCAEPPCGLLTVMLHVPAFCGVTCAVNVLPFCDGFDTATSAPAVPALHAASGVTVSVDVGTETVMVTSCAYAEPVPENESELGAEAQRPGRPAATRRERRRVRAATLTRREEERYERDKSRS